MGWLFSKLLARFALLVCTDAGDAPPVEVPPPQRSPAGFRAFWSSTLSERAPTPLRFIGQST